MEITELDEHEQFALLGLVRLLIKADAVLSEEENAHIVGIRDAMGNTRFQALATRCRREVRSRSELLGPMAAVERQAARKRIYDEVAALGAVDGLADSERDLLGWIKETWSL